ncbi:MAG: hypothetical protein IKD04_03770 [Clostridia bacterium]|nr:hypothetical protein [Clostridia bacterium]
MIKLNRNLVPDTVNTSPDYYCTWQTQLYASNDGGPQGQRDILNENALFGRSFPNGWTDFYPDARRDLLFVMDDSWDVPYGEGPFDSKWYGSLILDAEKFPSFAGEKTENKIALKAINEAVKQKGWRGLGGWICAQTAPAFKGADREEYWKARLLEADFSGWSYWKIDWGEDSRDIKFRKMINTLKKQFAPKLIAEQAMITELVPSSDVYRTYDVPAIMSIPMTMEKLAEVLVFDAESDCLALIDCEDEVYIAAALGCSMGVMRHPMAGPLPDGRPDPSFPDLHRNLKTKLDEVTRAVRWHRLAPAFAVNGSSTVISDEILTDTWQVEDQPREIEAWWKFKNGDVIEKRAPAAIVRGLPLPAVVPDSNGDIPFITAAKNPNGAVSIATLGRTVGRSFKTPKCELVLDTEDAAVFGIFGEYKSLTLKTAKAISKSHILAQDLLDNASYDITDNIIIGNGFITVSGELIYKIGTMCAHSGDTSEPGLIIKIENY